ncbi:hypothetical protein [Actinomycetospora termitidis]|uniref:Anti-sigma factor n=1 Tax=Actinomycetospora termitidis TaxID=3053470 RepID=A0ABT7MIH2_9PSEU|nr:hypothetical protein [Actinomycetospora sp. Odt1-22]MDL5160474.1 hypothetical protein [Actinomycetospora sp. Odt1-22]
MSSSDDERDAGVSLDELVAYEAGELTGAEEERLRMRIARDPAAQTRLARMRAVRRLLPSTPVDVPDDMPDDMASRVESHLRREVERFARGDADPEPPAV